MMVSKRKRNPAAHELYETDKDVSFEGEEEGYDQPAEEIVAPQADCPFSVEYRSSRKSLQKGKKAKRHRTGDSEASGPPPKQELDQSPPEDSTVYTVKPKKLWDTLKKYRNFVVGTENFALNEYIFVNHSNIPHGVDLATTDDTKFWVARVLEIRAVDESHVYLRVYWLYWPEELPGGRQPYHGQKELIASNHMEIIDAMTVSGRANVKHWMELDEDEELPDLFWRQKFDFQTQSLMRSNVSTPQEVREHCRCHRYYNPDKLMYGCPHCKTWLHEECIIDDVRQKLYNRLANPATSAAAEKAEEHENVEPEVKPDTPAPKKRGRKSLLSSIVATKTSANAKNGSPAKAPTPAKTPVKSAKAVKEEAENMFEVKIKPSVTGPTMAVIRNLRAARGKETAGDEGVWEEEVCCLLCNGIVS
ncbi:hypothetical protein RUND412_008004 [Rhizina undulata]